MFQPKKNLWQTETPEEMSMSKKNTGFFFYVETIETENCEKSENKGDCSTGSSFLNFGFEAETSIKLRSLSYSSLKLWR